MKIYLYQAKLSYTIRRTKLREQIRQAMLGKDQQTQSEFRFIESKVVEKMKEVRKALSAEV